MTEVAVRPTTERIQKNKIKNKNNNFFSVVIIHFNGQWNAMCGIVTVISPVNVFDQIRERERTAIPDLSECQKMNCRWPSIRNESKNEIWTRRTQVKRPLDLRPLHLQVYRRNQDEKKKIKIKKKIRSRDDGERSITSNKVVVLI